jgi:hypothetical protein
MLVTQKESVLFLTVGSSSSEDDSIFLTGFFTGFTGDGNGAGLGFSERGARIVSVGCCGCGFFLAKKILAASSSSLSDKPVGTGLVFIASFVRGGDEGVTSFLTGVLVFGTSSTADGPVFDAFGVVLGATC